MRIETYSDGSATTADKEGGWGAVIVIDGVLHKELAGHLDKATNNDAELVAAIKGLDYVLEYLASFQGSFPMEDLEVSLVSDSEIVLNWANGTYKFKQQDKMPLYDSLIRLVRKMKVKTRWVRGHNGDVWNERCDKLANNARKGITTIALDKPGPKADTNIGTKKTGIVCLYYGDVLKVVDLENNIIENYNRDVHGKRGSAIEIREEKER